MTVQRPYIDDLTYFLDASPVNFGAVQSIEQILRNAHFRKLDPKEKWTFEPGGEYYLTKNSSAIFAFRIGCGIPEGYHIISAHSDSPGFRIKPNAAMATEGGVVRLDVEVYGGPILYTWFDRPLSIAGRVILRGESPMNPVTEYVDFRRPLLTIPHLAIHFNRSVNEGNPLSKQKDMLPVIGIIKDACEAENLIPDLICKKLGCKKEDILDFDLSLYDTTKASRLGVNDEFICSGRLDDLSMVHAALTALLESKHSPHTQVMAIFDNEETGSGTKQGAASPTLEHILRRINIASGGSEEDFYRQLADSFMISADNAHAFHPNYPEKYDPANHPKINGGPVIKINANCKYMTDADSAAVYRTICERAGVRYQYFVNHSDVAGGSTLGNILTSHIDIRGVDMGAAIWAMHSCRETAGAADHEMIIKSFIEFYNL